MSASSSELGEIFLRNVPLMDVRAPIEFAKGALPGAINLPLMSDDERQRVGTCYKERGQQAAIELGHRLVSGSVKSGRIAAWVEFARANPQGMLYCARGGLRSQIVQQWMATEAGSDYPRVPGGYKALRAFLMNVTQSAADTGDFVVLSGLTGSGKTEVLHLLVNGIDLEGHARHRGSSFGSRLDGQPAQIDFENSLAIDFLKKRSAGMSQWVVEDEGRHIGSCAIPLELRRRMEKAPIVWLEEAFEHRVERILREYVVDLRHECEQRWGAEMGYDAFAERLKNSLMRIQARLGGVRYKNLLSIMEAALRSTPGELALDRHRDWITIMLRDYYDPMYKFQQEACAGRVRIRGDRNEVVAYLQDSQSRPAGLSVPSTIPHLPGMSGMKEPSRSDGHSG